RFSVPCAADGVDNAVHKNAGTMMETSALNRIDSPRRPNLISVPMPRGRDFLMLVRRADVMARGAASGKAEEMLESHSTTQLQITSESKVDSTPYNSRRMRVLTWLFAPEEKNHFLARWIFLRALGLIYFSAFFSLLFQIKGLIGPRGILPAFDYLPAVAEHFPGWQRLWFAPTLFWWSSSDGMLMLVTWVGLAASVAIILNLWPRTGLLLCFVCFLAFVGAAQEFSGYQSDGMLLEAGFISLFFAPAGVRPRFGLAHPPSR